MKPDRLKGIFSWYGFTTPLKERFKKIKTAGFDSTMLWWGDDLAFKELNKSELINEAERNSLLIENVHVPFEMANDIWSEDSNRRNQLIKKYKEWIKDCSKYNIPTLVMHISRGNKISVPNEYGFQSIETLVNEAEKLNINIALENTRKNNLLEYLLTNIQSRNLGLCYDTSHAQLYGDEDFNLLHKFKGRILCFHISDNDGIEDKHWPIGKGIIDWNKFIRKFPKDYKGIISLEVYPKNNNSIEEDFLSSAYESINNICAGINDKENK